MEIRINPDWMKTRVKYKAIEICGHRDVFEAHKFQVQKSVRYTDVNVCLVFCEGMLSFFLTLYSSANNSEIRISHSSQIKIQSSDTRPVKPCFNWTGHSNSSRLGAAALLFTLFRMVKSFRFVVSEGVRKNGEKQNIKIKQAPGHWLHLEKLSVSLRQEMPEY